MNKLFTVIIAIILFLAIIGVYSNYSKSPSSGPSGSLNIAGSTTVLPLNQEWARLLMEKYPDLRISVSGGGSGNGIKSVGLEIIDIGATSRDIKDKEFKEYPDLELVAVAKDSVAVVVHPSNPLSDIKMKDIAKIYAGEITNFKDLGGPDIAITVYSREEGSGTRSAFEDIVLKKFDVEIFSKALIKSSNGELRAAVSGNNQGITYLSMGYLDNSIKVLSIDGVEPTVENVKSGDYTVVRSLYLITKGEPSELEGLFIEFALSPEGQIIVDEQEYITVG